MVRKSKQLRPVMTRIPEGLRRKLEGEAKQNGCSMNAEIIDRLESSFRRQTDHAVLRDVQDIKQQLERLTAPLPTTLLDLEHLPAPAPIVGDVRDLKEMVKTLLQQSTNKGENPK
jgi:DNA polymerase/3'-5' exonuclease PolX